MSKLICVAVLMLPMLYAISGDQLPTLYIVSANTALVTFVWDPPVDTQGRTMNQYFIYMRLFGSAIYDVAGIMPATKRVLGVKPAPNPYFNVDTYEFKMVLFYTDATSVESAIIIRTLQNPTSPANSMLINLNQTIKANQQVTVTVKTVDINGSPRTVGGDLIFMNVTNYCERQGNFPCIRSTNTLYGPNILTKPIMQQLTDHNDGTYTGSLNISTAGNVTLDLFLFNNSGLYGEYFLGMNLEGISPFQRIDDNINFLWGHTDVFPSHPDNVSARWIGKIRAPVTGQYSIKAYYDNGIRIYINDSIAFDHWSDYSGYSLFTWSFEKGKIYDIRIEYNEGNGVAFFQLYWIPPSMSEEFIFSEYFWYPQRIASSPYRIEIKSDPPIPIPTPTPTPTPNPNCSYATGNCLGEEILVNSIQNLTLHTLLGTKCISNVSANDQYEVTLIGPAPNNTSMNLSAVYVSSNEYHFNLTIPTAGNYTLSIKLLGVHIKGSPFNITAYNCHEYCIGCTGPNSTDCIACNVTKYVYPRQVNSSTCIYMCLDANETLYIDSVNKVCKNCTSLTTDGKCDYTCPADFADPLCGECYGNNTCKSCSTDDGVISQDNQCACDDGYTFIGAPRSCLLKQGNSIIAVQSTGYYTLRVL